MVGGTWMNADGLYLKFGTTKTVPNIAGDYLAYGTNRIVEALVDLTKLSATPLIISDITYFSAGPSVSNWYIESTELVVETAAVGASTLSLGLIQTDRTTIPATYSTAFINAAAQAAMTPAGVRLTLVNGSTYAGGLIGTSPAVATGPYYITATGTGTPFTAGLIRCRIYYHGIGVITQ